VASGFFALVLDHVLTSTGNTFPHAFWRHLTGATSGWADKAFGVGLLRRVFAGLLTTHTLGSGFL